jgi:hypothetical protein
MLALDTSSSITRTIVTLPDGTIFRAHGSTETGQYKITLININDDISQKQLDSLIVYFIDLSYSMVNTDLERPFLEAVHQSIKKLFIDGQETIHICFWGSSSYCFPVNESNYESEIVRIQNGNYFSGSGTYPQKACTDLISYLDKIKNKNWDNCEMIFTTDGQFHETDTNFWKTFPANFCKTTGTTQFSMTAIGVVNDHLNNIKSIAYALEDHQYCAFSYHTIQNAQVDDEFISTMLQVVDNIQTGSQKKVIINDITFELDNPVYLTFNQNLQEFFKDCQIENIEATVKQGVSIEWKNKVFSQELSVAMTIQKVNQKLAQKNPDYKSLLSYLIECSSKFTGQHKQLIQSYKSIKTRKISEYKALHKMMNEFYELTRQVQALSNVSSDKEAFAIKTQLTRNARHNDSLVRRFIKNKKKFEKEENDFTVTITDTQGLAIIDLINTTNGNSKYIMSVPTETLNAILKCYFTLSDWLDTVTESAVLGIPCSYNWKDNDDWAPSKSYLEIQTGLFISIQGMEDAQMEAIGLNPLHKDLYNARNPFLKLFGDTKCNSMIPVATDPTFMSKFSVARNYLAGIITGSEYGFRSQHILFYTSVFKQLLNMLVDNDFENTKHLIELTINTFRILFNKYRVVFEKDDKPVSKERILYYIATGDTTRHYFASSWDSAIIALVSNKDSYMKALEIYNTEQRKELTLPEFKIQIYKMVFRNMWIHFLGSNSGSNLGKNWSRTNSWNIPDEKIIAQAVRKYGESALRDYILSNEKISANPIPNLLQTDIDEWYQNHKLVKLFKAMLLFADTCDDTFYTKFNKSFLYSPMLCTADGPLTTYFQDPIILKNLMYWTTWEKLIYGEKECYPFRNEELVIPHIVNRVNSFFSGELRFVIKDIQELETFRKRRYETRYLPVTFTVAMESSINKLFASVYARNVDLDTFRAGIKDIIGPRYYLQIEDALVKDQIDVLKNLFEYCCRIKHSLIIKDTPKYICKNGYDNPPSNLPYSCPANTTSPRFLQSFGDSEFRSYYAPVGMGNETKKYKDWIPDLHNLMSTFHKSAKSKDEFIKKVLGYVKTYDAYDGRDLKNYEEECGEYYDKF